MSNQVNAFMDHVKSHEALREELLALPENEDIADKVIALAAEAGFSFNKKEFNAVCQPKADEQLTEDELDKIAGGGTSSEMENIFKINCINMLLCT